ncbi:ribosome maturation factor RimP [Thiotrichales bacterium HSG1]|nr:ribosome maturation factor RimP [Thiotrichales bacterium HSG1]
MLDKKLQELLSPTVAALGYELVGIMRLSQGGHGVLLRIYIDSPNGIKLSDCEKVSHQVDGVLAVNSPIQGHYTLEVSSPGLERPLFTLEHFMRFIGHKIKVHLIRPQDGRRNFMGTLQKVQNNDVVIMVDGAEYNLPFERIDKAHIVPE